MSLQEMMIAFIIVGNWDMSKKIILNQEKSYLRKTKMLDAGVTKMRIKMKQKLQTYALWQ